ncbi:MAG: radical SAM protein [Fibrobacteria bacterium]|nr:radical SAM protein [Fibrobacteria bacterium]
MKSDFPSSPELPEADIRQFYRRQKAPYSALLELSYACNLHCFHCYNHRQQQEELTIEQIVRALKQLADLGCLQLMVSGGELFCRDDWRAILEKARELGFALNLFTNGTLITEDVALVLKKLGVLEVNVTLFSADANIHDKVTGVPGSHVLTLKGLAALQKAGLRTRVQCLLMKQNLAGYQKLKTVAERYNAQCYFSVNLMPRTPVDSDVFGQRLERADIEKLVSRRKLFAISECGTTEARDQQEGQLVCDAGVTHLVITPYGEVSPCVYACNGEDNLRTESLGNIWKNSDIFKQWRETKLQSLPHCVTCRNKANCGRCRAMTLVEEGNVDSPSSWACLNAEILSASMSENRIDE